MEGSTRDAEVAVGFLQCAGGASHGLGMTCRRGHEHQRASCFGMVEQEQLAPRRFGSLGEDRVERRLFSSAGPGRLPFRALSGRRRLREDDGAARQQHESNQH